MRNSLAIGLLCLSFGVAAMPALAEGPHKGGFQYNQFGATPPTDDALFQALGGTEKITAFTKDFVARLAADNRIGKYFQGVDLDHLAQMLTEQFIELSGGPVKYSGREMTEVHQGLGIHNADFNRLAEDLQVSMDKFDVPFTTQSRLIALLASMQRAVVTE